VEAECGRSGSSRCRSGDSSRERCRPRRLGTLGGIGLVAELVSASMPAGWLHRLPSSRLRAYAPTIRWRSGIRVVGGHAIARLQRLESGAGAAESTGVGDRGSTTGLRHRSRPAFPLVRGFVLVEPGEPGGAYGVGRSGIGPGHEDVVQDRFLRLVCRRRWAEWSIRASAVRCAPQPGGRADCGGVRRCSRRARSWRSPQPQAQPSSSVATAARRACALGSSWPADRSPRAPVRRRDRSGQVPDQKPKRPFIWSQAPVEADAVSISAQSSLDPLRSVGLSVASLSSDGTTSAAIRPRLADSGASAVMV
jgi:hypothetical protein